MRNVESGAVISCARLSPVHSLPLNQSSSSVLLSKSDLSSRSRSMSHRILRLFRFWSSNRSPWAALMRPSPWGPVLSNWLMLCTTGIRNTGFTLKDRQHHHIALITNTHEHILPPVHSWSLERITSSVLSGRVRKKSSVTLVPSEYKQTHEPGSGNWKLEEKWYIVRFIIRWSFQGKGNHALNCMSDNRSHMNLVLMKAGTHFVITELWKHTECADNLETEGDKRRLKQMRNFVIILLDEMLPYTMQLSMTVISKSQRETNRVIFPLIYEKSKFKVPLSLFASRQVYLPTILYVYHWPCREQRIVSVDGNATLLQNSVIMT